MYQVPSPALTWLKECGGKFSVLDHRKTYSTWLYWLAATIKTRLWMRTWNIKVGQVIWGRRPEFGVPLNWVVNLSFFPPLISSHPELQHSLKTEVGLQGKELESSRRSWFKERKDTANSQKEYKNSSLSFSFCSHTPVPKKSLNGSNRSKGSTWNRNQWNWKQKTIENIKKPKIWSLKILLKCIDF